MFLFESGTTNKEHENKRSAKFCNTLMAFVFVQLPRETTSPGLRGAEETMQNPLKFPPNPHDA